MHKQLQKGYVFLCKKLCSLNGYPGDNTKYMLMVSLELATPELQTQCSSHWGTAAQKLLLGRSWLYPVGVLHHCIFIISQLWLTSHSRSTVVLLDTGTPGTSREIYERMPIVSLELATPRLQTQCSSHWATGAQKLLLGRSWLYPVGVLHHCIFIISQLWLTSHSRSTVVLQNTGTPGTSREIYERMPIVSLELATPRLQTQCSSHWATGAQKLLVGRSWVYPVVVLHHCIFIISQLWLTSHPRSTVVLLDTGTPCTSREIYVRMPIVSLELATPGLQAQCSSHWATGAQKLLLGRSWVYPVGVLHHCISIISQLWLTSDPRSTVILLDTGTPCTSRDIYVRMPMVSLEVATLGLQAQCSSHWATGAQKLLLVRSWVYPVCVLHHCICYQLYFLRDF